MVEHHLAKVRVAGSNPVVRSSEYDDRDSRSFFYPCALGSLRYNEFLRADVAQLVEHHLAKVRVAGSNPVVRSSTHIGRLGINTTAFTATWPSGKAEACKAFIPGSNPGVASRSFEDRSAVFF